MAQQLEHAPNIFGMDDYRQCADRSAVDTWIAAEELGDAIVQVDFVDARHGYVHTLAKGPDGRLMVQRGRVLKECSALLEFTTPPPACMFVEV